MVIYIHITTYIGCIIFRSMYIPNPELIKLPLGHGYCLPIEWQLLAERNTIATSPDGAGTAPNRGRPVEPEPERCC